MNKLNLLFLIVLSATNIACSNSGSSPSEPPVSHNYEEESTEAISLMKIIEDKSFDGQVRMAAVSQLAKLDTPNSAQFLIDVLRQDMKERTGLWAAVIPALGSIGKPEAVPVLLEALTNREEDWLGREMAAEALGSIADPGAVESLIESAYYADTRGSAFRALTSIGDARAAGIFIEALDETEDPDIIEAAHQGLLQIGRPAMPALEDALKDYSEESPNLFRRNLVQKIIDEISGAS